MIPGVLPQTVMQINRLLPSDETSSALATKVQQVALNSLKNEEDSLRLPLNKRLPFRSLEVISPEKGALFETGRLSMMIRGTSY